MNQVKNSFYNYTFIFTAYVLTLVAGLGSTALIARLLGPEGYGCYNMFLLVANALLLITSTWVLSAAGRFAVEEFAKHKTLKDTFSSEVMIIAIMIAIMSPILYLFRENIAGFIRLTKGFTFASILLYLAFFSMFSLLQQCFLGASKFKDYGIMPFVRSTIFLLILIFVLFYKKLTFRLDIVIAFLIISYFSAAPFYFRLRKISPLIVSSRTVKVQLRDILLFAWPIMLFSCANFTLNWIDKYFIKILVSTYAIGIYAAAWTLTVQFTMIPQLLYSILLPIITSYRVKKREDNVRYYLERLVPQLSFLFSVAIIGIIVFSNIIISLLYGAAYSSSANIFIILSLVSVFTTIRYFYNPVSLSYNYIKLTGSINVFCALLNAGLNYLFISRYGIGGAAVATSLSSLLAAAGVIFVINNKFNLINFRPIFCSIPVVLVAIVCILIENFVLRIGATGIILFFTYILLKRYEVFQQKDLEFIEKIRMPLWLRLGMVRFYKIF